MKPALTAEEWKAGVIKIGACSELYDDGYVSLDDCGFASLGEQLPRHATAALCLYGQPFGFTREDIQELLSAAEILSGEWGWPEKDAPGLLSIADRIEALLPPEGS